MQWVVKVFLGDNVSVSLLEYAMNCTVFSVGARVLLWTVMCSVWFARVLLF